MNKAILMGRLTKDPEIRYTQSSEPLAVARYTLAVNRRFKKDGEPDADFINCVAFGRPAEFAERYFKKGMLVAVSGRIQVSTYDDQSGQKRWSTDIVIEEQDFAESKSAFEGRNAGAPSYNNAPSNQNQAYSQPSQPNQPYTQSNKPSANKSQPSSDFSPISESADDEDLPF